VAARRSRAFPDHSSRGQNFFETPRGLPGFHGMNSKIKTILLAATVTAGLLSSAVVSSAAVVLSDLTVNSAEFTAPAPVKIVHPVGISRRHEGETVRVSLTIDDTGRAHNVHLVGGRDPDLVKYLLPAVAQWQFSPAKKNGRAVTTDVVLPIELVDNSAF
jgi:TonB family protein